MMSPVPGELIAQFRGPELLTHYDQLFISKDDRLPK